MYIPCTSGRHLIEYSSTSTPYQVSTIYSDIGDCSSYLALVSDLLDMMSQLNTINKAEQQNGIETE